MRKSCLYSRKGKRIIQDYNTHKAGEGLFPFLLICVNCLFSIVLIFFDSKIFQLIVYIESALLKPVCNIHSCSATKLSL